MVNRVRDAAIEVLKDHQAGIKLQSNYGGEPHTILLKPVTTGNEALNELATAIAAMDERSSSPAFHIVCHMKTDQWSQQPRPEPPYVEVKSTGNSPSALKELANTLADAGVNFPGSDAHRTKTV